MSALDEEAARLGAQLDGRRVVALAGAGLSTESGIPDYRGNGRPARTPIWHRDFVASPAARARYWARSLVGWPTVQAARPNPAHHALAALEAAGRLRGIITQNVDGLEAAAGCRRVVQLHGSLWRARCLHCAAIESRADLQARLRALNPGFAEAGPTAPDGDAEVGTAAGFQVPPCLACGGVLKPDVVFFGDNVARPVLDAALGLFDEAEVLLVLGSSLSVWSGFRFVRRAAAHGVPVVIANLGPTRGDPFAALRIAAPLGHLLPRAALNLRLTATPPAA